MTILYFIIAIGILILVHELGHFIVARRSGIRVEKFSIGFGPKIFGFTRGETEYKIAPIPLGGYVKMTGEDPDDPASATDERSFANKSVWTRVKVVGAGPVMNILFALIFMPLAFFIGRMEPAFLYEQPVVIGVKPNSQAVQVGISKGDVIKSVSGKKVSTWKEVLELMQAEKHEVFDMSYSHDGREVAARLIKKDVGGFEPGLFYSNETFVDAVLRDSPAQAAGIQKGDKIVSVNGLRLDGFINGRIEMTKVINDSEGASIEVAVDRNGEELKFNITPEFNKDANAWLMGIKWDFRPDSIPMVKKSYGIEESLKKGFEEFYIMIGLTLEVLKKLFAFELSYKSLGGPVQIAQISGMAARQGLGDFIYFLAFLSIQLGILNLLPIPVLDGGHIAFCGVEAAIRRPIPTRVRVVAQYFGLVIILSLFTLITINDIDSVWGIKKLIGKLF